MQTTAQRQAAHAVLVMAAIGFWAMTMLFIADVAVLTGWVTGERGLVVTSRQPAPASSAATPEPAPTGPVTVDLDGASVEFPGPVSRTSQPLEVAGAEASLLLHTAGGADGTTFNMGVVDYPDSVDLSDPAVNLLASVSGAAGNIGGRILEQTVTAYDGHPAVAFRIETPTVRLAGRNILVGRRMYAQNVAYRGGNDPPGAKEFFDSLSVVD